MMDAYLQIAQGARIGLLGGAFDPPHLGHQLLALSFLALEPIDELWIIPCADHAVKDTLRPFHHRLKMCEKAFQRIQKIRVLDLENKLPKPNYTIETITTLLNHRPDLHLTLGLGSDLIQSFPSWHKVDSLIEKVAVAIFERASYPIKHIPPLLQGARIYTGHALPDANSTKLRELLYAKDLDHLKSFIDQEVLRYIYDTNIYGS